MNHAYKTELLKNLIAHYDKEDWVIITNFLNGQDEILVILPDHEPVQKFHERLFEDLSLLPEIDHPCERVLISFCHRDGSGYCSRLINPSTQDEIHVALLGRLPYRRPALTELQDLRIP